MLEHEGAPKIMSEQWGIMQMIKSKAFLFVHVFSCVGYRLGTRGSVLKRSLGLSIKQLLFNLIAEITSE